jgi:hypothetical protein
MIGKKLYTVKFKFFSFEYEHSYKKPCCLPQEYCEFLFNWSLETAKQLGRHIFTSQPVKFFISSVSEVEAVTSKKDVFLKILEKNENKRIDKFELISIIPFIVENNFEVALTTVLNFFCLEQCDKSILMRDELGLFIDSYFRMVHSIIILDDVDEIYEKTQKNLVRLSDSEIEEIIKSIFDEKLSMNVEDVVKNISKSKICSFMKSTNLEMYGSLKNYEKNIKENFNK